MTERLPATTDLSVERILKPLIDVFPGGATAERLGIYADLLRPLDYELEDIRKGVGRLIHVWDRTTFPPFAKLRGCVDEERALRLRAERARSDAAESGPADRALSKAEADRAVAANQQLRKDLGLVTSPHGDALLPGSHRMSAEDQAALDREIAKRKTKAEVPF